LFNKYPCFNNKFFASTSYADSVGQSGIKQADELIQKGVADETNGNVQDAVNDFRSALVLELSKLPSDSQEIWQTFNLYG